MAQYMTSSGPNPEPRGHDARLARHAALADAHRLGRAGRPRGEQQKVQRVRDREPPGRPARHGSSPEPVRPIGVGPGSPGRRTAGHGSAPRRCRARPGGLAATTSVTMSWQSAWAMSRASSAPRRVGLIPTTVAPASAAPPRRKRYSGTFSRSTPTWNGPGLRRSRQHAGPGRALRHHLAPTPCRLLEAQAGVVVLGARHEQVGHRGHRRDDSLKAPMGISEPRDLDALRAGLTRWVSVVATRVARRPPRSPGAAGHRPVQRDDLRRARMDRSGPGAARCRSGPRGWCGSRPTARVCSLPTTSGCRVDCKPPSPGPGCRRWNPSPSRRTTPGWARPSWSCPGWPGGWCGPTSPTCAPGGWPRPRPRARRDCTRRSSTSWPGSTASTGSPSAAPGSWRPGPAEGSGVTRRRARVAWPAEVEHWARYLAWAGEGSAPAGLRGGRRVVSRPAPGPGAPAVAVVGRRPARQRARGGRHGGLRPSSTSRWRRSGPAEVDLAWFVVLHDMAVDRCGGDLPGFPGRDATIAAYRRAWAGPWTTCGGTRPSRRCAAGPSWCAPPDCWPAWASTTAGSPTRTPPSTGLAGLIAG